MRVDMVGVWWCKGPADGNVSGRDRGAVMGLMVVEVKVIVSVTPRAMFNREGGLGICQVGETIIRRQPQMCWTENDDEEQLAGTVHRRR